MLCPGLICEHFALQLTVLNTELIQRLHRHGGWDAYIFEQVPKYVQNVINKLEEVVKDETVLYDYLGCIEQNCDNHVSTIAQQSLCDTQYISFGNYLRQNSSSLVQTVLTSFTNIANKSTKVLLLKSIYQHLMNSVFDVSDNIASCDATLDETYNFYWKTQLKVNNSDTLKEMLENTFPNNSNNNLSYVRINLTEECSLVSVISILSNYMLKFSKWPMTIWSFAVCSADAGNGGCEEIEADFDTILSYFLVIRDFVQIFVLPSFANLSQAVHVNSIYHTKSQRELALGYTLGISECTETLGKTVKGILQSHSSFEDVFYSSPKIVVSTCLEQGNSDNNMIVRGKLSIE